MVRQVCGCGVADLGFKPGVEDGRRETDRPTRETRVLHDIFGRGQSRNVQADWERLYRCPTPKIIGIGVFTYLPVSALEVSIETKI